MVLGQAGCMMRDVFKVLNGSVVELRSADAAVPYGRQPTKAEADKIVGLIKEVNEFLDQCAEAADEEPMTSDEEISYINARFAFLSSLIIWLTPKLKAAKGRAKALDDLLADFIKRGEPQGQELKRLLFYRARCKLIIDYPGTPEDPAPDWSRLVGAPFWQYPPPGGFPWWLLLVAGGLYLVGRK